MIPEGPVTGEATVHTHNPNDGRCIEYDVLIDAPSVEGPWRGIIITPLILPGLLAYGMSMPELQLAVRAVADRYMRSQMN